MLVVLATVESADLKDGFRLLRGHFGRRDDIICPNAIALGTDTARSPAVALGGMGARKRHSGLRSPHPAGRGGGHEKTGKKTKKGVWGLTEVFVRRIVGPDDTVVEAVSSGQVLTVGGTAQDLRHAGKPRAVRT